MGPAPGRPTGRSPAVVAQVRAGAAEGPAAGGRTMTLPVALLLVVAGFAAGLSGTVAGLASLFSYPALLAAG